MPLEFPSEVYELDVNIEEEILCSVSASLCHFAKRWITSIIDDNSIHIMPVLKQVLFFGWQLQ